MACFLAKRGKMVTLVEQFEDLGFDIGVWSKAYELGRLHRAGITIMTKNPVREIIKEGIVVDDNGKSRFVPADTVVLAVGVTSDRELLKELATAKVEVYAIGDCVVPRDIMQATSQGFNVGCSV
ncbi:MAG: FAD-dependent oxidoreductase [Deltaproteobacteria bacterium]|nr:FAD-dependent oxidoreductase [Deltaproteobacteria bacterium]